MKHVAKILDLCVFISSFILANFLLVNVVDYHSRGHLSFAGLLSWRVPLSQCLFFFLLLLIAHGLFSMCGLYTSKRLTRRRSEALELCKAAILISALLLMSGTFLDLEIARPRFVFVFCGSLMLLMVSTRLAAKALLLALREHGRNRRFVLIAGTNNRAIEFARQLDVRPELGYEVLGFVDDDWTGIGEFLKSGYPRCCDFAGLADFLRHNVVDETVIYLPLRSYYQHTAQLAELCQQHGIAIRFAAQLFDLKMASRQSELDEHPELLSVVTALEAGPALFKRILDCVVSFLLLIALAPLLLAVALLVKLSSRGPVLFRQIRVGLNKRQFIMYKFRTMIAEAEQLQEKYLAMNEMTGPVFKIRNDPRITPLGRFLRKTSIDELPQLLNVLKGEMSLVGPRAMSLRDYSLFDQDWHRRRFCMKPGITCLWQINGRSSVSFSTWMELDMQYIDKWSFWLDLKILARTLPVVLRGTGAI